MADDNRRLPAEVPDGAELRPVAPDISAIMDMVGNPTAANNAAANKATNTNLFRLSIGLSLAASMFEAA